MTAQFSCPGCNFARAVPAKDLGKRAKCPKCGAITAIVAAPEPPAAAQAKVRLDQTVLAEPVVEHGIRATSPQAGPASKAPPSLPTSTSAHEWHYTLDGEQLGPVSESDLRALIRRGAIRADDQVWAKGMTEWRPADEYFDCDSQRPRRRRRRRRDHANASAGQVCGILACIFGGVAFVFCPILLGLAGIVLGIVSVSISENKTLGIVGIAVACAGLVIGVLLGILVFSAMQFQF